MNRLLQINWKQCQLKTFNTIYRVKALSFVGQWIPNETMSHKEAHYFLNTSHIVNLTYEGLTVPLKM